MNEPKWTPGPWRVGDSYDYNAHHIVPIIPTGTSWQIAAANASMLKPVPGQPNHVREDRSEIIANAHLIAAAPDLYAALEPLGRAYQSAADDLLPNDLADAKFSDTMPLVVKLSLGELRRARAALAKARGEGEKS